MRGFQWAKQQLLSCTSLQLAVWQLCGDIEADCGSDCLLVSVGSTGAKLHVIITPTLRIPYQQTLVHVATPCSHSCNSPALPTAASQVTSWLVAATLRSAAWSSGQAVVVVGPANTEAATHDCCHHHHHRRGSWPGWQHERLHAYLIETATRDTTKARQQLYTALTLASVNCPRSRSSSTGGPPPPDHHYHHHGRRRTCACTRACAGASRGNRTGTGTTGMGATLRGRSCCSAGRRGCSCRRQHRCRGNHNNRPSANGWRCGCHHPSHVGSNSSSYSGGGSVGGTSSGCGCGDGTR